MPIIYFGNIKINSVLLARNNRLIDIFVKEAKI